MKKTALFLAALSLPLNTMAEKKKNTPPPTALQTLYRSLDTKSILQHLAFYELYPDTKEGKEALSKAWTLLSDSAEEKERELILPQLDVSNLIGLLTKGSSESASAIPQEQIQLFERGARRLENRKLDGHSAWTKTQVLSLPSDEVDLARALLIYQFEGASDAKEKIESYEMTLDLMALEILAHLKENPSAYDIISEMNRFIFHQMGFRFPPHSLHVKDIDLYTFLPSVMDSRLGVCLGVSTLYLCLAQRIGLELTIITPPGHILLSYGDGPDPINIETTARGIHMPSDTYLGIATKHLEKRTMKEVIGMAFFNQAPVMERSGNLKGAIELYETALQYMPTDARVKMLLGIHYLFDGQKQKGRRMLSQVTSVIFEGEITTDSLPEDYLSGKVDEKGIKLCFMPVDETRASILSKQKELKEYLKKYPKFRAGLLQLAVTYLQLGRSQEAFDILMQYQRIDANNPIVAYYLSIICMQRLDYPKAWQFYKEAEKITSQAGHHPRALRELQNSLRRACACPA